MSTKDKDSEPIKTLCFGITNDISTILCDQDRLIDSLELLYFAMFIVSESYIMAGRGLKEGDTAINDFHSDMLEYIVKKSLLRDDVDVNDFCNQFLYIVGSRYLEYRRLFWEGNEDQESVMYLKMLSEAIDNIFARPVNNDDKSKLILPLAVKIDGFYKSCLETFKAI